MAKDDAVDLLQGTLDMLVLKAVSLGPLHGYGVLLRIQQISQDRLEVQQGSLYPALYRLEHEGWIAGEWGQSENKRRARYYRLTAAGRRRLEVETKKWNQFAEVIGVILNTARRSYEPAQPCCNMVESGQRRHDALDRQVQEELEFHLESYAEDLMRSGVPREQAMRRARAELGSVAAGREKCRAAWGSRFVDELWADLRYALRMLGRSPGFAAIAVGSLALGIGVNTVIFTAAQHMLLDRLVVPHPEQLRLLEWTEPQDGVVESMWGWWDDSPGGGADVHVILVSGIPAVAETEFRDGESVCV